MTILTRTMPLAVAVPDALTITAVVVTSAPVRRRDARGAFNEVLSLDGLRMPKSVPLVDSHQMGSVRATLGRAANFRRDGNAILADLTLSTADDVAPVAQRVRDATITDVSIGYPVSRWAESTVAGVRTLTATDWTISEVSLVTNGADQTAKLKRSDDPMALDTNDRAALVENLRSACGLSEDWATRMAEGELTDDEIRESAREAMLTRTAPARIRTIAATDDPTVTLTRAADAVAFRMAGGALPDAARPFVGMSLKELATDALARAGISTRGLSADEVFTRAQTTSDFPLVVSNAMGKVALDAYRAAESPLKALARQRTLPNFKTSTAIRLGELGRLQPMTEDGEFKHTSRAENGESMTLRTFGQAIKVSRKLLIDDDLNLLGDLTSAMGAAAAQTEAEELVALLTGNPNLSDGDPVFSAGRGNYATTGSALSETSLTNARKAMRKTKGLDGKTIIDALPRYLVVGPDLETAAEKLLTSIYAATTDDVNAFAGKLQLVVEPRLTGNGWYLMADSARVPSIQYAYLSAAQGVQIQRQESWDTLGLSYRAFLDFGCGWLDWRGAYHATGAA
jgi:hypothetical protein